MFHNIPPAILGRMQYLETLDAKDRAEGIPSPQRLRQIPPETGKFIALLAASAPEGIYLEMGTSAGYSTLWLALACKEIGRKLVTFEVVAERAELAVETFRVAGVEQVVDLVIGDARQYVEDYRDISFCFLDLEKEIYYDCYERVIPNMVTGGLLVADNVISHRETLREMSEKVLNDERIDALVVPIGSGELVCRKL